jgi:hypothetical protein
MAGMLYRRARRAIGTLKSAYSTDTVTAEKHVSNFLFFDLHPNGNGPTGSLSSLRFPTQLVERSLMLLGAAAVASAIVAHTGSEQPQIPTYISDAAW